MTLNIEELKKEANVYRTRFQMLIEAQLELLKSDDWKSMSVNSNDEGANNEAESSEMI
ncbi:cell division initiation protein DivIVA [Sporolactobacillus inulinus]|uniref:Cell division initiation protein DivIVA n=1 Tax=Sporolactobacillus inulinus TaxID=2078 RepID=A0A4Y1ZC36_9BACL|nr:cell division initiation protein DivIVA [Sporolactobacillus inulinus]